jgi:hypothetical protein
LTPPDVLLPFLRYRSRRADHAGARTRGARRVLGCRERGLRALGHMKYT